MEYIKDIVLPFAEVLPLSLNEYHVSVEEIGEDHLKPSDTLHVASMRLNGVAIIASENRELDVASKTRRIWLPDLSTIL